MENFVFKVIRMIEILLVALCLASFKPAKVNSIQKLDFENEEKITFSNFKYSKILNFSVLLKDKKEDEKFSFTFDVQKLNDIGTFYVFADLTNEKNSIRSDVTTISSYVSSTTSTNITISFSWDVIDNKTKIIIYSSRSKSSTALSDSVYFYITSPFETLVGYEEPIYYEARFENGVMTMKKECINFGDYLSEIYMDYYIRINFSNFKVYFSSSLDKPIKYSSIFLLFNDPLNRFMNVFDLENKYGYRCLQMTPQYNSEENSAYFSMLYIMYVNTSSLSMYKRMPIGSKDKYIKANNCLYLPIYNYEEYKTLDCYIKINNFGVLEKTILYKLRFKFADEYALDSFYISSNQGKKDWGETMETINI